MAELDPNKTYLVWKGSEFPNSENAAFKAPAGSSIDWGDGTVETFDTASATVNTHTYTDGKTEHTIAISGLTSIGYRAFYRCNSLRSITIGNSVTSIGDWAFNNCWGLTSVTIGNSVTSIGHGAFSGCNRLTSITIPNSVTSINGNLFDNCSSLRQLILFPSTPPTLGSNAIPSNVQSIYVQQSSKAAYQAATNWTTFASKIVSDNIYLSFVRFNQKNKEYIDRKVDGLSTATNLENGTGLDSLVQKYSGEVDETHYASSTTGESDVCLGEANTSSGKRNIIGGKLNENAGSNNLVVGLRNNISSNHNVVGGQDNAISQGHDNLIGGQRNTVKSYDNVVAGHENTVSENGLSNVVAGEQNLLGKVVNSIICGDNNYKEIEQLIDGIKAGRNLLNNSDIQGKALFGRYNSPKTNTLVEVGNGTSEADRKNAFEVLVDGRAKVQSAPIESDDVVRLSDLKAYIQNSIVNVLNTEV